MKRFATISVLCFLAMGVTLYGQTKAKDSPVVGTWNCVAHGSENGDVPFTLYLAHSSQGYTGTVSAPQGDADLTTVEFKDNQLKITIDTGADDYMLTATLAGKNLVGKWSMDGQEKGDWEGKK